MPVTFGGQVSTDPNTGKATVAPPDRRLTPPEIMAQAAAQRQFADLQKDFQQSGNRPDMAQLNQLERSGANTFGTGMRGRFDVTGSGEQPYSRSQVGQLRNTLNDPSLQTFDRNTGMNPLGLGVGAFSDYFQGRENRLGATPMGQVATGIANAGNFMLNSGPMGQLMQMVPERFRQTPPNRVVPSALQAELQGKTLPPEASFTPPAGLASIGSFIPNTQNFLQNLDFGALLNASNAQNNENEVDPTSMDNMIGLQNNRFQY